MSEKTRAGLQALAFSLTLYAVCGIGLFAFSDRSQHREAVGQPSGPVVTGGTPPSPQASGAPKVLPQPVSRIDAVELWRQYGDNPIGADGRFKDRYIEVSGTVRLVQKDEAGRYSVGLSVVTRIGLDQDALDRLPARELRWQKDGYPPNVICFITPGGEGAFAALREDASVKIIGCCKGNRSAEVYKGYVVVLEDCRKP